MDAEAAQRTGEHAFEVWIRPEVERRRAAGELPADFEVFAAQVIFDAEGAPRVRLNYEVKIIGAARPSRQIGEDDEVTLADLERIESLELTEDDPNQAHVTLMRYGEGGGKWFLSFDFRHNAARMAETARAAREFLDAASWAVESGRLRVAVDTLFSATELMAKGLLLALPGPRILRAKDHKVISSTFNRMMANPGNTDPRYARLLKRLEDFRGDARYLKRPMRVGPNVAREMLALAEQMHAALVSDIPERRRL
jgi:uncharacterized protein (UPF0332 family)